MVSKIEISHRTIIFIVAFLASIWFILAIRDILFLLFISFILMSAIRPSVEWLERYRIPRVLSILLIYSVGIALVTVSFGGLIPMLITQTTRFISDLPRYIQKISPYYQIDIRSATSQLAPIGENLIRVTVGVFSNLLTTLTVLMFTFYMLLERKYLENSIRKITTNQMGDTLIKALVAVEGNLGAWLRGELILMICVGLLTFVGLSFLGVDVALPLAIIAGLLEIIPVIGPFIAAVPAVLVALSVSPILALAAAALYFIVQQIENNIIVPIVMKRAVGLSPLIVIIALMIGSTLAGITGAVLSIPIVVMLRSILFSVFEKEK